MTRDWRTIVAEVERTATAQGRTATGRFSLEGTRLHERALRAGVAVHDVLVSPGAQQPRTLAVLDDLERAGTRLHRPPGSVMEQLTEGRDLGGIVGLASLPPARSLTGLLSGNAPVILVGVEIQDPGNTGALVRTALAAGAAAYLTIGQGDPFHPRAVRTSMGSLFKIPAQALGPATQALDQLRNHGVRIVGAVSSGGEAPMDLPRSGDPVAVLVGNEAFGLPGGILAGLDARVTIPMADGLDSYSVNAAAAVLLYELCVRRR